MAKYIQSGKLQIAKSLYQFVNDELLPHSQVEANDFWLGFESALTVLAPKNNDLLEKRVHLQKQINEWHLNNKDFCAENYKSFLQEIEYFEPEAGDFQVTTANVDAEVTNQAGPQLVVPVNNPRYALNAANARWGSLYDALYGADIISEESGCEKGRSYNPVRGEQVIQTAKGYLDEFFPLEEMSHNDVVLYQVQNAQLIATLSNNKLTTLKDPQKFVGYRHDPARPEVILLKNNELHVEIQINTEHPIGKTDHAGVKDIVLESAITAIMDCEDSIAAVDAEDKVDVYRKLFELFKGSLSCSFKKGDQEINRMLQEDRVYVSRDGQPFTLSGRSLMFIRNVGHLMTTSAVLFEDGSEAPEGIMDAFITALIGKHDILNNGKFQNSKEGSIYIVKPKMHSAEETAFANELFNRAEDVVGLFRNTIKIGVMDEERRMSLNLKAAIHQVKDRVAFINTGFLDRTGDEIHTSFIAGPMIRKAEMKSSKWLQAYEESNVKNGLVSGLPGHAQIGKGMWAMPDRMKAMMQEKIGQLEAGANTAWVPSPTAATLHALHYHMVDVANVQNNLDRKLDNLIDDILDIPVSNSQDLTKEEIQQELDNNAQGILGYVVKWIDQGIGCSKVPDINDIGLMEDRATLRISSQHMANWLYHGLCTKEQVITTFKRMAKVVDAQNADDEKYEPMAANFENSQAFQAACDLVLKGFEQPSGYTEPILHKSRLQVKEGVIHL